MAHTLRYQIRSHPRPALARTHPRCYTSAALVVLRRILAHTTAMWLDPVAHLPLKRLTWLTCGINRAARLLKGRLGRSGAASRCAARLPCSSCARPRQPRHGVFKARHICRSIAGLTWLTRSSCRSVAATEHLIYRSGP